MKVDIVPCYTELDREEISNKVVIVIDVLRATSTIVTAIKNECSYVIPVESIEYAKKFKVVLEEGCLLGGERNAVKIDGFDFSNSPLEYSKEKIKDKSIILTTTNGTRAIKKSDTAFKVLIGCFLNSSKVIDRAISFDRDIVLVNAGTNGKFSMDDFICSGYLVKLMKDKVKDVELTDIAYTAYYMVENEENFVKTIRSAAHYRRMMDLGLEADFDYCMKKNIIDIVPEYKDGKIS